VTSLCLKLFWHEPLWPGLCLGGWGGCLLIDSYESLSSSFSALGIGAELVLGSPAAFPDFGFFANFFFFAAGLDVLEPVEDTENAQCCFNEGMGEVRGKEACMRSCRHQASAFVLEI